MPLQVRPATEADARRFAQVEHDAYSVSVFNTTLFPGPFPGDPIRNRADGLVAALRGSHFLHWFKVVDTDIPAGGGDGADVVAFAEWHVYHPDPPAPAPKRTFGPGTNPEACDALFNGIGEMRQRHMSGKPYVYLRYLQTDPKHQRRGAGRLLMQWGLDEAERLGIPVWLESSPEGKRLYETSGLEVVDELSIDTTQWGGPGILSSYAMRKDPSSK